MFQVQTVQTFYLYNKKAALGNLISGLTLDSEVKSFPEGPDFLEMILPNFIYFKTSPCSKATHGPKSHWLVTYLNSKRVISIPQNSENCLFILP